MDELEDLPPLRHPTARRPLLGMTVLAVEDSRFACEALRLMCLHSGARIRRADCLESARRHLKVYRPSVAIIDVGLPDGTGLDLIRDLDQASPRVGVILGTSGDDNAQAEVMGAGADGFLLKPVDDLAAFQQAILRNLPADKQVTGPRALPTQTVDPDPVAYRDDMNHVATILQGNRDGPVLDYVAQFLRGVARAADDRQLVDVVADLTDRRARGLSPAPVVNRLTSMLQDRLRRRAVV